MPRKLSSHLLVPSRSLAQASPARPGSLRLQQRPVTRCARL